MILFVVGTGTDVGKTHVTASVVARARGASAWKPIVTGTSDDVARLEAANGAAIAPPLHAFAPPISPHLAARAVGITIRAAAVAEAALRIAAGYELLLVESAGGLFSPISETETNFDIARALGDSARMLLVAPDRLGVLHDVTACMRGASGLEVVALSAPEHADASTGTNAAELERLGLARTVIVFPREAAAGATSRTAGEQCLRAFGLSVR